MADSSLAHPGIVYQIRHRVSLKSYVGITTHTLKSRWGSHRREAGRSARWLIHRAIAKYGNAAFEIIELECCEDRASLNAAEVKWVAQLGTLAPSGYNMTLGGGGARGFKRSEESKRQTSARHKGRSLSAETRAKISAANKGRKATDEQRAKMSIARKGRVVSQSAREKTAAAHRGMKRPAEAIERMRQSKLGKPMPESARVAHLRPVIAEGVQFSSLSAAVNELGIGAGIISRRIRAGSVGYQTLKPPRRRAKRNDVQAMRLRCTIPVLADNRYFMSITFAAEALGITRPAVSYRIKIGRQGYRVIESDDGQNQSRSN